MASSNNPGWRVKIMPLPASITFSQLAQTLGLPTSRVYVPQNKGNDIRYGWINEFINGSTILGETIKCVVSPPRTDEKHSFHSSPESLMSGSETIKKPTLRFNKGNTGRQESSNQSSTPVTLMSTITSGTAQIDINDDNKRVKLPSHHSNRYENPSQSSNKPGPLFHQTKTSGKFLYPNS
jgi:hypothetical protein